MSTINIYIYNLDYIGCDKQQPHVHSYINECYRKLRRCVNQAKSPRYPCGIYGQDIRNTALWYENNSGGNHLARNIAQYQDTQYNRHKILAVWFCL